MPDARSARATRLLDPRWHWIATARDRLYAELDADARICGLSITVESGGDVIAYALTPHSPEIIRRIIDNPDAVADSFFASTTDATLNMEDL